MTPQAIYQIGRNDIWLMACAPDNFQNDCADHAAASAGRSSWRSSSALGRNSRPLLFKTDPAGLLNEPSIQMAVSEEGVN
jgi:hypothetical protein